MYLRATLGLFFITIHTVLSANNDGCTGLVEIKSEQELNAIRGCQVFDGSITIHNITTEQDTINLSQLERVHGNLVFNGNGGLSQIILASLKHVDGQLAFQGNQQLKRLDLTQLTAAKSLDISVQPALDAILFPSGLSQIESVSVTDTIVSKIEGITTSNIKDIHIANNNYLKNVNLNHLEQVAGSMTIAANSPNLTLDVTSLRNIYQGDFRNLAKIEGLNNIQKVTGDLSFVANTFRSLSLPNITQIAGTLTVSNNLQLQNLSIPYLQILGGALSLSNNTQLSKIDVPRLQQVDGTVDITGNFDKVELPNLMDIRGGLNVQTSSDQFSCDDVNKLKDGVTKGHEFKCKSNVSNPKSGINDIGNLSESSGHNVRVAQSVLLILTLTMTSIHIF